MRRWLLALLPALLLLLGGQPAHAAPRTAPADAPQAQTFGIQPATATDPDGRGNFGYSATPGAVVKDHVAVWNYGDQPLTLRLYPADAFNTDSGGYDVLPEGKPSTQAGAWLRTAVSSLELPARSRQIVPFTLAVPRDATPGDHAAGIVVALRQESKDANGNAVSVDQRVGTRVNIRVSGDLRAELSVQDARAVYHPSLNPFAEGRTTLTYTVRNTGNVRLGGKQTVRVTNAFGSIANGAAPADLQELLPGSGVTYRVQVSGAYPTLWSTAGITIDPMAVNGDRDPKLSSTVYKHRYATIPWTVLVLLVLVVGLGLAIRQARRRNRRLAALRPPVHPVVVTVGLALLVTLGQFTGAHRAAAEPVLPGTLSFDYATGHDDDAIDLLTDGKCPDPVADYLGVKLTGPGFPAEGVPLIGTTAVTAYRPAANGGFVIPLSNTLRVIANRSGVSQLTGDYTITASCRAKVNPKSLRDFTGTLTFTGPTTWKAGAVAADGVIHAAAADPTNPPPATKPAAGSGSGSGSGSASGDSATSIGSWLAVVGGLLLLGWIAVPQIRKARQRRKEGEGDAPAGDAGPRGGDAPSGDAPDAVDATDVASDGSGASEGVATAERIEASEIFGATDSQSATGAEAGVK
ncbi:hypothetical protein AB0K51_09700 [Kitasatospora sp. NPDC049285]|uniref:hypothetical protein n=1 Tax=Kitasatospora sp. NPDC049285 TaxID=3157096 RepID=UPI00341AD3A2